MIRYVCCIVAWIGCSACARGDVDYETQIKPLLAEKCIACHGPVRQESGLRLDAAVLVQRGSDGGAVAVAGQPDESLLIERTAADAGAEQMPPAGEGEPLTAEQSELLRQWIAAGMPAPEDESFLESPQDHWAYQPVQRPEIPGGATAGSAISSGAHPVDAFIAAGHQRQSLQPLPPADRATWLRRVYLDLIGLPPTPEQLDRFQSDRSPDAYDRVVDTLLASPQYGERWGRHWMDVWRYSDWDGYKQELRGSQRHIWRWRDWIIRSLCDDKGYDQMVLEMIAADEIAPEDPQVLAATGYLARNYHKSNRNIWLDATVEHTAKAFLGMTLDCARCHDHKFDPLSQAEYYQFRAVFEPHQVRTDRVPGQLDVRRDGLPRAYDADLDAATYLFVRGDEKQPDKENPVAPGVPAVIDLPMEIQPVQLSPLAATPGLREFVQNELVAAAQRRHQQQQTKLRALLADQPTDAQQNVAQQKDEPSDGATLADDPALPAARLDAEIAEAELTALTARIAADEAKYLEAADGQDGDADAEALAREAAAAERQHAWLLARRDVEQKQAAVEKAESASAAKGKEKDTKAAVTAARKALQTAEQALAKAAEARDNNDGKYTAVCQSYPRTSTGRRTALARWIIDPRNPLTARVAVNHIWLRHFGMPLVENVFDFGLRSPRPPHAELLDWLAAELMDNGWSMKHVHRLITTSQAYQRASSGDAQQVAANAKADPDNQFYWRFTPYRLDAEVIRDSLLQVAGRLDPQTGGPDVSFEKGESVYRRSVYFQHAYEKQMQMLTLFDAASPNECYRRSPSVIPQQALVMANSDLSWSLARQLARDVDGELESDGDDRFIEAVFRRILGRSAAAQEQAMCREFLVEQRRMLANPEQLTRFESGGKPQVAASDDPALRSRENLVHVLLNHNDFVMVR